jgi:hypothetical protein
MAGMIVATRQIPTKRQEGTPGCELGMKPFVTSGWVKGRRAHNSEEGGGIVEDLLGGVKGYQGSRGRWYLIDDQDCHQR